MSRDESKERQPRQGSKVVERVVASYCVILRIADRLRN
jgi:hypothetical protein